MLLKLIFNQILFIKKQDTHGCRHTKITGTLHKLSGYKKVDGTPSLDTTIQQAIQTHGPVAASIDASHDTFQHYKGGVIKNVLRDSKKLNHAVVILGWGHDVNDGRYWIVRNCYGPDWGENGHLKIQRGFNTMGIRYLVYYPIA